MATWIRRAGLGGWSAVPKESRNSDIVLTWVLKRKLDMRKLSETPHLDQVRLIEFPQIHDPRGDLTPIESGRTVPFEIARVYYVYNVPVDALRGGHAHRKFEEVLIALSGSFRVVVDDGHRREEYWLRDPGQGLYIGRMVWRELDSFSQGGVSMVLASHHFDEADYYRDYAEFTSAVMDSAE
mgnify:CR=1 FL=1